MAPLQTRIIEALREAGELSMPALVGQITSAGTSAVEVRSAVLPLISAEKIELTPERNLRLRETK